MSGLFIRCVKVDGEEGRGALVEFGDEGGEVAEGGEGGGDKGREVVGRERGEEGREISEGE